MVKRGHELSSGFKYAHKSSNGIGYGKKDDGNALLLVIHNSIDGSYNSELYLQILDPWMQPQFE